MAPADLVLRRRAAASCSTRSPGSPEYYPTRTERSILDAHAQDIVAASGADTLVELGSGTSEKTRLLLDALCDAGRLRRFVPLDVSEATLRSGVGRHRRPSTACR